MADEIVYKKVTRKADKGLEGKVIAKHGKQTNQKLKPYVVLQYLLKYSDENNTKSAYDIIGYLEDCGISAERRSIYRDIEDIKASVPKGTQMPTIIKQQIDTLKAKVSNAEPERKELVKQIEAIRNTLPYNRFVMTTNMLVPLDDENFRDNPDIVAFKYGGNISIFGYVTNIVSSDETPVRNNDFAPLYDTINQIMINMFKEQKKIYVVHPVALFY